MSGGTSTYDTKKWLEKIKKLGLTSFYFAELKEHHLDNKSFLRTAEAHDFIKDTDGSKYRNRSKIIKWKIVI